MNFDHFVKLFFQKIIRVSISKRVDIKQKFFNFKIYLILNNSLNSNYLMTINFKQFISIIFLILNVSIKQYLTKSRSTKSNSIMIYSLKCRLILINFCSQNHYEFESTLHEKSKSNRRSFINLL